MPVGGLHKGALVLSNVAAMTAVAVFLPAALHPTAHASRRSAATSARLRPAGPNLGWLAHRARALGPLQSGSPMAIAVVLRIRSQARLHAALAAVSTPGSPQYGHYLTQSQANSLFNPTAAQQNAVVAWLSAAGFTITHTFANHLAVDARGSTRDVERTFHVSMVRYAAGSPGERYRFHAATGIPRFPARLSSLVLTILGLNDAPEPSVRIEELRHGNPPYFPQDLADAYDVNPLWANGADGIGQRIGITLDTPAPSDKTLEKWARFTATDPPTRKNGRLVIHRVDGGNETTDDGEAGLDVEFSTGMAPGATVDFWFMPQLAAPFDYNSLNLAGTTSGSTMDRQITSSWGGCEDTTANQQGYDEMFASNATTGHDYFFPAGDNGSYCNAGAGAGDDPFPNYPASDPNVTSVGGTRFLDRVGDSVNPGVYPGEGELAVCRQGRRPGGRLRQEALSSGWWRRIQPRLPAPLLPGRLRPTLRARLSRRSRLWPTRPPASTTATTTPARVPTSRARTAAPASLLRYGPDSWPTSTATSRPMATMPPGSSTQRCTRSPPGPVSTRRRFMKSPARPAVPTTSAPMGSTTWRAAGIRSPGLERRTFTNWRS